MNIKHKLVIGVVALTAAVVFLGQDLSPIKKEMFQFHDQTQAARAQTFAENVTRGQIPPRIAPGYSFNLGYPLFNYYAPAAYWITSVLILCGVYIITAIKLSLLGGLMLAFIAMFGWLYKRFSFYASLLGAFAYVTSPYFAVEIFVRGSLSEIWFLAFLPLCLYLYDRIREKPTYQNIFWASIATMLLATVHNIMSPIGLAILIFYMILYRIKEGVLPLFLGILMSVYFIVPALMEMKWTHAVAIAAQTEYKDHFLCVWQLWTSRGWQFGGSAPGCDDDGFSFKLGKLHFIFGLLGVSIAIWTNIFHKKEKMRKEVAAVMVLGSVSLFLTTYASKFVWDSFSSIFRMLQFPWRFLVFGMFSLSYFSAYAVDKIKKAVAVPNMVPIGTIIAIGAVLAFNIQYFQRQGIPYYDYATQYLSEDYKVNHIVYYIAEYLPNSVELRTWLSYQSEIKTPKFLTGVIEVLDKKSVNNIVSKGLKREATTTSNNFYLNIHRAPYWNITIDDRVFVPTKVDKLGRPLVKLSGGEHRIRIEYRQTLLEKLSNIISLIAFGFLLLGFVVFKHGSKITQKK